MSLSVLMTTEGTYPHASGGVSTWCDTLLRNTPDIRYTLLPLMMNPHVELKYEPPPNVRRVMNVPLWGIEEPAEFITEIPFATLFDRKRRTSASEIQAQFVPLLRQLLRYVNDPSGGDVESFGRVLLAMEDYFRLHDYNDTFKARETWQAFCEEMKVFSDRAKGEQRGTPAEGLLEPSLFDLTECLRWLYRFLIVLNARVPRTSVTHSTAAAFCGIPCITAKLRHGTPMILTEHGVYLREQYLFLSRFRRLFFCKQFLLNLITAIVRANYAFADIVAPVCHWNTRWETALDTPQHKIRVVHNGVDPDIWSPSPAPNVGSGHRHVIATARIDPLKDIETFLRVAARVHETDPDVRFTVYGVIADQAYYRRCLALRAHLRLDDVVTLGKPAADVVAALHSADLVLLTSISEAFPYSVLEAMACGKAVVASDVGGVGEALEGCGVLVKPRDDERFAVEIRSLLGDRARRERLGAKARERVLEEFRLDHAIGAYRALYRDLAGRAA
jgi:glycosyltransferase involved in cell wall biosynthesis